MDKSQNLRTAFKLHKAGVQIKKMQIKRKHPHASTEELRKLFSEWIRTSNPPESSHH